MLSTNISSHTEFRLFIFDSVRVITCLVKSVFLYVMDGGNEERVAIKFCFYAGLSVTETLVLVQKAYGNEGLNGSNVFRWYSRLSGGRELVENDERDNRPKSTRTEVHIAAVADLVKNDGRIASRMTAEYVNISKTVVLRRKLCERFVSHSLTSEQGKIESHLAKTLSPWPMQTNFFLTKLLREMIPGVLSMTPKQSDTVLNGLVRHPLGRRN